MQARETKQTSVVQAQAVRGAPEQGPDAIRAGGAVKISEWEVGTPERQDAAIAAIAATWKAHPHTAGLWTYRVHRSSDGRRLLHYSRWESERIFLDYQRRLRDDRIAQVDGAVPGIERLWLESFRHYRTYHGEGTQRRGACVVCITAEADSPALLQRWIDLVISALEEDKVPGLIAADFHVTDDAGQVLILAQWESADAHERALQGPHCSPLWQQVRTMPGVRHGGFTRYHPAEVIVAKQEGAEHA
jgi:quinol monooxygenase YgiN